MYFCKVFTFLNLINSLLTLHDDTISKYQGVRVARNLNGKDELVLPVEFDGCLAVTTLTVPFPRANGLKFMSSGFFQMIRMNQNRTCFLPPFDGWTDRKYIVIYKIDSPGPDIADVKKEIVAFKNDVNERLKHMDNELKHINNKLNNMEDKINRMDSKLDGAINYNFQIYTMILTLIALVVSVASIIYGVFKK
uniref:TAR DNA-binding protein 43 N-terminal domain-containing protein n=1 Tax=Meloidogyne incognita TaxID=6306 RepID=A0A914NIZ3_MELIC